jgi:hypothetical protein
MGIEAKGAFRPLPALAGRFTPEDISRQKKRHERIAPTALSSWSKYLQAAARQAPQREGWMQTFQHRAKRWLGWHAAEPEGVA